MVEGIPSPNMRTQVLRLRQRETAAVQDAKRMWVRDEARECRGLFERTQNEILRYSRLKNCATTKGALQMRRRVAGVQDAPKRRWVCDEAWGCRGLFRANAEWNSAIRHLAKVRYDRAYYVKGCLVTH